MLAALASSPATKALDPDPFPRHSLRHAVYATLLHFGLETAYLHSSLSKIYVTDEVSGLADRVKRGEVSETDVKDSISRFPFRRQNGFSVGEKIATRKRSRAQLNLQKVAHAVNFRRSTTLSPRKGSSPLMCYVRAGLTFGLWALVIPPNTRSWTELAMERSI